MSNPKKYIRHDGTLYRLANPAKRKSPSPGNVADRRDSLVRELEDLASTLDNMSAGSEGAWMDQHPYALKEQRERMKILDRVEKALESLKKTLADIKY